MHLQLLQVLPENRVLRGRLISFLHRLVECLGERLLPYLPPALSALLPLTADASTVSDVCALLSQLALKYKAALVPLLAEASISTHLLPGNLTLHAEVVNSIAPGKGEDNLWIHKPLTPDLSRRTV